MYTPTADEIKRVVDQAFSVFDEGTKALKSPYSDRIRRHIWEASVFAADQLYHKSAEYKAWQDTLPWNK